MKQKLVTLRIGNGGKLHAGYEGPRGGVVRGCGAGGRRHYAHMYSEVEKVSDGIEDVSCRECLGTLERIDVAARQDRSVAARS